jgi:hypothetical protein
MHLFPPLPRLTRRTVLTAGAMAGVGAVTGQARSAQTGEAGSTGSFGRAKRCLLLYLTGGPPQLDTFDMKPEAPSEIRGELSPIATSAAGVEICELFPQLAREAHEYCLVRSVTHDDRTHNSASYAMLTGHVHPLANCPTALLVRPTPDDHPFLGSMLALHRGRNPMTCVSLPEYIKDANVNDYVGQLSGFLGPSYSPLTVEADDARENFRPPELVLKSGVDTLRFERRVALRDALDYFDVNSPHVADVDDRFAQAVSLFGSNHVQQAFAWESEPESIREAYGSHLFGKSCLLARRLLEAGVTLATVYWHYEGPEDSPVWDTHWNNFKHLRERLIPPADLAISAVIRDLRERGMLDDTLVVVMSEFGRTPRINGEAGRDHWAGCQSVLLAGAGIVCGSVYGSSDRIGAYPASNAVAPVDMVATILHALGVQSDFDLHDRAGRPVRACTGQALTQLWGM